MGSNHEDVAGCSGGVWVEGLGSEFDERRVRADAQLVLQRDKEKHRYCSPPRPAVAHLSNHA